MRPRRGPPSMGSQCKLPRSEDTSAESAPGAGPAGAQSPQALPAGDGNSGGDPRNQPVFVTAGLGLAERDQIMIAARRLQRSFAAGLIMEEVKDLWEPWMRHADEALNDDALLEIIQQELSKRCRKSKTRGRPSTPAEVVLRMLLLKHMRGWSFDDVSREVRANLVY